MAWHSMEEYLLMELTPSDEIKNLPKAVAGIAFYLAAGSCIYMADQVVRHGPNFDVLLSPDLLRLLGAELPDFVRLLEDSNQSVPSGSIRLIERPAPLTMEGDAGKLFVFVTVRNPGA
jgi:hypothetical protein